MEQIPASERSDEVAAHSHASAREPALGEGSAAGGNEDSALEPPQPLQQNATQSLRNNSGRPVLTTLAWACALASLFGPLAQAGIWDPYELEVAELARRIAINLMNAPQLVFEGVDNTIPILRDLGRGQLPFSSIALGFKVFGVHDWAGRLPLALWGLLGIVATYVLVRRLLDKRGAPFAVLMLASCPLYFLHARTMLGDVVTMASLAIACAGLGLAVFDQRLSVRSPGWGVALGSGVLGLLCGFASRGVLLGVAVPCLAIALAHVLTWPARQSRSATVRDVIAWCTGVLGLAAVALGTHALLKASASDYSMWVGSEIVALKKLPTHDAVLHALGHGMLPWSALLPFAVAALLRPPPVVEFPAAQTESALRVLIMGVIVLAVLAQGLLAPFIGELPFCAVFAFAVAFALLARDLEREGRASLGTGIGALALLVLLTMDFRQFPEKGFSAFMVGEVKMPDSFKGIAKRFLEVGALLAALGCFVGFWEGDSQAGEALDQAPAAPWWRRALHHARSGVGRAFSRQFWRADAGFSSADYRVWPATLRDLFHGNPLYTLVPVELFLIAMAVAERRTGKAFQLLPASWLEKFPKGFATYAWMALLGLVLLPFVLLLIRDLVRGVLRLIPVTRASVAALGFGAFGLILSLGYYPALASQVSPREVFDAYRRFAQAGEELGLIGDSSGSAAYYAGSHSQVFPNVGQATSWLIEPSAARRYLVVAASDLAKLNAQYRAKVSPPKNLPVIDARSSEILLVSNQLAGAVNQNPLQKVILDARPQPAHPIDASYEDELECLGWEVTTPQGQVVAVLSTGTSYQLRIYYEVKSKVSGSWKTFIHLDGADRINLDHEITAGKVPLNLWAAGDFIVDVHEFDVARGQASGRYTVNIGLFSGSKRKKVSRGQHVDNRLSVGHVDLR